MKFYVSFFVFIVSLSIVFALPFDDSRLPSRFAVPVLRSDISLISSSYLSCTALVQDTENWQTISYNATTGMKVGSFTHCYDIDGNDFLNRHTVYSYDTALSDPTFRTYAYSFPFDAQCHELTDYCKGSMFLYEAVCDSEQAYYLAPVHCGTAVGYGSVCSEGACTASVLCDDSDSTVDEYQFVSGITTVYHNDGSVKDGPLMDSCSGKNKLTEYACAGNKLYNQTITCPFGCDNGACFSEPQCVTPDELVSYPSNDQGTIFLVEDTLLCPGEIYVLPEGVSFAAHHLRLDCQNAVITGDGLYGISVVNFHDTEIAHCEVTGYTTGFNVRNNKGTFIHYALSHENSNRGLLAVDTSYLHITDSSFIANDGHGIDVILSDFARIEDNYLHSNGQSGLHFLQSSYAFIAENSFALNNEGLFLGTSSSNAVSSNMFDSHTGHGLSLYSSSDNIFEDNTFLSGVSSGIYLDSSSGNIFSDNIITQNSLGISLLDGINNLFVSNHVCVNDQDVALSDASYSTNSFLDTACSFVDPVWYTAPLCTSPC